MYILPSQQEMLFHFSIFFSNFFVLYLFYNKFGFNSSSAIIVLSSLNILYILEKAGPYGFKG